MSNQAHRTLPLNDRRTNDDLDPLDCPNCGANRVVVRRPHGAEWLLVLLLPRALLQCLHCYHRFAMPEGLFDRSLRAIIWVTVLIGLVLVVFFMWSPADKATNDAAELQIDSQFTPSSEQPSDAHIDRVISPATKIVPISEEEADAFASQNNSLLASNGSSTASTNLPEPGLDAVKLKPQELEQQVALAKAQSEEAERLNQERKKLLQTSLARDPEELESLLRTEVSYRIYSWRDAWQAGQIDEYLAFYSQNFQPNNELTLEQWKARRKQRVSPSKKIELELRDFEVSFDEQSRYCTVVFDQFYRSGTYSETSRKQLVFVKEWHDWKIVSEVELHN